MEWAGVINAEVGCGSLTPPVDQLAYCINLSAPVTSSAQLQSGCSALRPVSVSSNPETRCAFVLRDKKTPQSFSLLDPPEAFTAHTGC